MRTKEEILSHANLQVDMSIKEFAGKLSLNGRTVMFYGYRNDVAHCEFVSASPMDGSKLTPEEIEYIKELFFAEGEEVKLLPPCEEKRVPNCITLFHYMESK